jgi:hypothetical protein
VLTLLPEERVELFTVPELLLRVEEDVDGLEYASLELRVEPEEVPEVDPLELLTEERVVVLDASDERVDDRLEAEDRP